MPTDPVASGRLLTNPTGDVSRTPELHSSRVWRKGGAGAPPSPASVPAQPHHMGPTLVTTQAALEPTSTRGVRTVRRLDEVWDRVKRRLASQKTAQSNAAPGEWDTTCPHRWTLVLQRDTWSGPLRLSTCSICCALLREWGTGRTGDSNG